MLHTTARTCKPTRAISFKESSASYMMKEGTLLHFNCNSHISLSHDLILYQKEWEEMRIQGWRQEEMWEKFKAWLSFEILEVTSARILINYVQPYYPSLAHIIPQAGTQLALITGVELRSWHLRHYVWEQMCFDLSFTVISSASVVLALSNDLYLQSHSLINNSSQIFIIFFRPVRQPALKRTTTLSANHRSSLTNVNKAERLK